MHVNKVVNYTIIEIYIEVTLAINDLRVIRKDLNADDNFHKNFARSCRSRITRF